MCIVDIGSKKTSVCCVEDGISIPSTRITSSLGSEMIDQVLLALFRFFFFLLFNLFSSSNLVCLCIFRSGEMGAFPLKSLSLGTGISPFCFFFLSLNLFVYLKCFHRVKTNKKGRDGKCVHILGWML